MTAALLAFSLAIAAGASSALAAPPFIPGAATSSHRAPAAKGPRVAVADRGDDASRYAAAERAQPRAARFEGGATFVIIGSTAAIVLGVVLLVVLL
ncbi:MAG TPA: hypothetical protein VKB80_36710 [Kofleriaceae bacterium]|nr:hypothetical protein [Kofleriaceae bacterium]